MQLGFGDVFDNPKQSNAIPLIRSQDRVGVRVPDCFAQCSIQVDARLHRWAFVYEFNGSVAQALHGLDVI